MAFTLTQAQQFLQDYDRSNGSARGARIYIKIVNDALRELYSMGEFDFSTRSTRLTFAAPYDTGTVSISAAGTAVTGSGTTFTSAMVGRFIRFNGEAEQYRITAYGSATGITVETYLGSTSLSGVTYVITDERKALPTLFRSFQSIVSHQPTAGSQSQVWNIQPASFAKLNSLRLYYQTSDVPQFYSVRWEDPTSGNVPVGYLYVYPAPASAQIATVYYDVWPASVASASDELPLTYEAEGVIREFLLAGLYREQGKDWVTQLNKARSAAREALGSTRSIDESMLRQEWSPNACNTVGRVPQIDPDVLAQMDP
jgi:hypothetical protein